MSNYLNLHKKAIFDEIKKVKLDPNEFAILESDDLLKLTYGNSKLHFDFKKVKGSNNQFKFSYYTFLPHIRIVNNYATKFKPVTFNSALKIFGTFLKTQIKPYIKELNTIDPWIGISKNSAHKYFDSKSVLGNQPFTTAEVIELKERLETLKQTIIQQFNVQENKIEILTAHFAKLIEATEKQNKQEWKMFAWGVLASIIVNLSFDSEQGKELFRLFVDALKSTISFLSS